MKYEIQQERLTRLFSILSQLSPYSQVTVNDLVAEYEVSPLCWVIINVENSLFFIGITEFFYTSLNIIFSRL